MAIFLVWLVSTFGSAMALGRFNKAGTGFLLGFVLGPLGFIIALVMRSNENSKLAEKRHQEQLDALKGRDTEKLSDDRETKKCPYCAETILAEATICRFCKQPVD